MDGLNTYTFGPSAPPVVDGATLDAEADGDAAVAETGTEANPTTVTRTASSRIRGEGSIESALMARSEPCGCRESQETE
jgi:hypothetical protein